MGRIFTRSEQEEHQQLIAKSKIELLTQPEEDRLKELEEKRKQQLKDDEAIAKMQADQENQQQTEKERKAAAKKKHDDELKSQRERLQLLEIELDDVKYSNLIESEDLTDGSDEETRKSIEYQEGLLEMAEDRLKELKDRPNFKIEPKLGADSKRTDESWRNWSYELSASLEYYELHRMITTNFRPEVRRDKRFIRLDQMTKRLMGINLKPDLRETVERDGQTAYEMHQRLKATFEGSDVAKTVKTVRSFLDTLANFKDMAAFVKNFEAMVETFGQMYSGAVPVETVWKAFFLAALPPSQTSLRTSLIINKGLSLKEYVNLALQSHAMDKAKVQQFENGLNHVQYEKKKPSKQWNQKDGHDQQHRGQQPSSRCPECNGKHKHKYCPRVIEREKDRGRSDKSGEHKSYGNHKNQNSYGNSNSNHKYSNSNSYDNYSNGHNYNNQKNSYKSNNSEHNKNGGKAYDNKQDTKFKSNHLMFNGLTHPFLADDTDETPLTKGVQLFNCCVKYESSGMYTVDGEFDEVNPFDLRVNCDVLTFENDETLLDDPETTSSQQLESDEEQPAEPKMTEQSIVEDDEWHLANDQMIEQSIVEDDEWHLASDQMFEAAEINTDDEHRSDQKLNRSTHAETEEEHQIEATDAEQVEKIDEISSEGAQDQTYGPPVRLKSPSKASGFEGVSEEIEQAHLMPKHEVARINMIEFRERIKKLEKTAKVCNASLEDLLQMAIYMDSGASEHMVCNPDWLYAIREIEGEYIKVANGNKCAILGFGHLALKSTVTDSVLNLRDCIVCPELTSSFLSHSKLDKTANIHVHTGDLKVRLTHLDSLIFEGFLETSGLYRLNFVIETPTAHLSYIRLLTNEEKVRYYHETFCHVNFKDLKRLDEKLGTKTNANQDCYTCVKAKIKELPFKPSEIKSTRPLQLVHSDLSGPINIPNRHRYKYFMLCIDDYSRFRFASLLKTKDEAFAAFKQFKTTFEKQLGRELLVLRSDNGTEYKNSEFKNECNETGMIQQFTVRGSPQQNGVAERGMGSVKQMARTILLAANLGASFWPFALLFAIFIQNRLPCSAIGYKIPFELFYGQLVNLKNIRKFGQRVIYREDVSDDFTCPGKDGIFLGYPHGVKGYYVYSIEKRQVLIRVAVRFLNDSPYDDKLIEDGVVDEFFDLRNNELYEDEDEELNLKMRDFRPIEADQQTNEAASSDEPEPSRTIRTAGGMPDNYPDDDDNKPDDKPNKKSNKKSDDKSNDKSNDKLNEQNDNEGESDHSPTKPSDQPDQASKRGRKSSKANHQPKAADRSNQSDQQSNEQTEYGQDQNGEIILSRKEFAEFVRKHPEANVVRVRECKERGRAYYRINSITAPKSIKQALESDQAEEWKKATASEMCSLEANGTWTLVPRPTGWNILPVMWLFAIKLTIGGLIDRFKARLVVLGNKAKIGRDFAETFAPVINELTFRLIMSYAVQYRMHMHHVDIKTAYLNAPIKGDVYVAQPPGFVVPGRESWVYKLQKSLYGLRESAYQWYITLYKVLTKIGFKRSLNDQCLYYGIFDGELVLMVIYVDDCLLACRSTKVLEKVKNCLRKEFELTDKGPVSHFLNLDIRYDVNKGVLHLSQSHYIRQLLEFTGMLDCNGAKTPVVPGTDMFSTEGELFTDIAWYQSVMGKLIYLSTHSRPDISFAVSRLCAHMHTPTVQHVEMVKRVLRYLKQTQNYRLVYRRTDLKPNDEATVYVDADYGNDQVASKSVTGLCSFVFGNLVDWYSRKQRRVASSTCQAEIYALVEGAQESEFIFEVLKELSVEIEQVTLFNDNESARLTVLECGDFAKNKHYRCSINSIRDIVQRGWLRIVHCPTDEMLADFLTKPLTESKLTGLISSSGIQTETN